MVKPEEIRDVADSAMIKVSDSQVESLEDDFNEVLKMFGKLDNLDTEDTNPSFHPIEIQDNSRKDEVEESLSLEQVFQNDSNVQNDKFKGPSV